MLHIYSILHVYTVKCTLTHIVIPAEHVLQNCAVLSSKFVYVTVSINGKIIIILVMVVVKLLAKNDWTGLTEPTSLENTY